MANLTRIKNNQITDSTITNVKIASGTLTGDLMNPQLTFNSNLILNGNLTVAGNFTAVQSQTTQITDPLITLGMGNPGTSYDLGSVLIRGSGGNRFMGWKENAGAFVFINTAEDGTTTGNIPTTSYSNVVVGNLITIGSTTHSDITLSGNTVAARGGLILDSGSGLTTLSNAVVMNSTLAVTGATVVQGTATVNELVSNGAIQGTTFSAFANATVNALTVNASAVVGSTLQAVGGIQNTVIGDTTPAASYFTTLNATGAITGATTLTTTGTATVNALVSNGAIQGTDVSGAGTGTFASVVSNGAIQGTTIGGSGTATFASVVSNGAIQGTAITGSGIGTFASVVSNGAIQGTTVSASANATVNALTVNASATVGSTLSAASIQNTPIGTTTAASAYFTTVDASGAITGATSLTTTGAATVNSLNVNSAATVGTTLVTGGTATVNALVSNTSIEGASLSITGNATVGNLTVQGNLITVNSQTLIVIDPIIQLNTGPNGSPLTTDNNFDSGLRTHYYDTADRSSFFGRKDSSGFLEYYSNVASEVGNVITGTYGTIKGGNLIATELASIGTTLSVGGNTTVNALTVNGAATVGSTLGVTGNLVSGNLSTTDIDAVNAVFTNNVTIAGVLTATSNVVANSSGIFFGNTTTGINAIYAGLPTFTFLPNVVAQFTTDVNNYSQLNIQNLSNGTQASGDLVITADNGTDTSNYLDLGIGSSNYNFAGYSAYYPNDGYLLIDGGNLLLNVESPGKAVRFVVGSYDETELVAYIDSTHLEVVKTTASTSSTDGAIVVAGGVGVAGAVNTGSTLNVVGAATVNSLVSNGAIQGTTVSASANATVNALTVNGSATVGTTLSVTGGIQNTAIGNTTAAAATFTTLTTAGVNSFSNTTEATGVSSSTGAVRILGGVSVAKSLFVGANAALGNVTFNNTTISSNVSNTGLTINPNGTGSTVINSGLNNSRTVINGTSANAFVVSGAQVGVNASSFISGATFQVNATDSVLLPVGTQGDRPGTPQAGMFRFSTTLGSIEWHNGTDWQTAATQQTVAVANTQQGNGSATIFTLPVANATTAGTIVSINGVVQQPVNAYSVSGSDVTFTEAPSSTDVIDFRVFTTTTQVTSVVDTMGTTGLFLDTPTVDNKVILFKTNGSESFSIQANSQAQFTGNVVPTANITYSLGTTTNRWKDLWLSGSTIYLGNVQVKEAAGSVAFYAADGSTPAPAAFNSIDHTGTTGTGNIGSSGSTFNTIFAKATSAQYADLAENYAGDAYYEPGTVVEFGGENEVTISTTEMSPRIAGVVSTNPAYLMNSSLDGFATPVALQGRVPCKVTGAVRKGDMMVSAGNGTARSATAPVMGSVIGKALENFDGEQGVIEVVVGRL